MTAEGASCCYRLDVSNVSISIYGAILTPTYNLDTLKNIVPF